jgi:vancomycin resistance protein VanJ
MEQETPAAVPKPARVPPRWARWPSAAYLVAVCLLALVCRIVAEAQWWTTFLLYIPQAVYLAPLVPLQLLALICRDRRASALNAVTLLAIVGPIMGLEIPSPRLGSPPGPRVRVLAYNIRGAAAGWAPIRAEVERFRPDVVVLSEALGWGVDDRTKATLSRLLPGWSAVTGGDVYVAARWPMVERSVTPLRPSPRRKKVAALVDAPFGVFHVVGVHFTTALHGRTLVRERRRVPSYMRHTAEVRLEQAEDLLEMVSTVDEPVILAGDFNTPPTGRIYRGLTDRLTDAFAANGWGWGHTYPTRLPLLRIDYVFHTRHWETVRCVVGGLQGSDHRAVFAELALR